MSNTKTQRVRLSIPCYGDVYMGTVSAILAATKNAIGKYDLQVDFASTSATPFCFNKCLQAAYYSDCDYWIMLHSDIKPVGDNWVDVLLGELEVENLSVISAVAAIKTPEGLTSTAVDTRESFPRRLTLKEINAGPETLTNEKCKKIYGKRLLINTGVMAWKMKDMRPLIPELPFEFHDRFITRTGPQGPYMLPDFMPEDWLMSRRLDEKGIAYGATRRLHTIHKGAFEFDSSKVFGADTDPQWAATKDLE